MGEPNFTSAPWVWHTSNSWKRLKRECRGLSMTVLEPFVHWRDQHPDCTVTEEDMALIAAAPELYEALAALLQKIGETSPQYLSVLREADVARDVLAKARGEVT